MMTPARERELRGPGQKISREEWRDGWHYCPDFDMDLCGAVDVGNGHDCCEWCGFDGSDPYPEDV